jgi:hypothetical protein
MHDEQLVARIHGAKPFLFLPQRDNEKWDDMRLYHEMDCLKAIKLRHPEIKEDTLPPFWEPTV